MSSEATFCQTKGEVSHSQVDQLPALYQMPCHRPVVAGVQVAVASFDTEMRQVDAGHLVSGADAQGLARLHGHQRLARFKDGQGAKQPFAIKFADIGHRAPPHVKVTPQGVTPFGLLCKRMLEETPCSASTS